MNRRSTAIVAVVAASAVAASTAAVALAVPQQGSATEVAIEATEIPGTPVEVFGTSFLLPEDLRETTMTSVEGQLAADGPQSIVFVDGSTARDDGLTTALVTVTPTNGLTLGTSNEQMQQWLTSLFPDHEGTVASLPVPEVPNASFTFTETTEEVTWQVTEYVFQYADAAVSVRFSTVDDTGEDRAEFDQIMASMAR